MSDELKTCDDPKWALARVIHRGEHLLHNQHMRRVCSEVNLDAVQALTPPQIQMVITIREAGCITIKQLAQKLYVKAPAASTMVDRLVELGILTREENPHDRREVLVRVSPKEETLIEECERRHLQLTIDLIDKIGAEHARMWGEVCKRIQEVLAADETA